LPFTLAGNTTRPRPAGDWARGSRTYGNARPGGGAGKTALQSEAPPHSTPAPLKDRGEPGDSPLLFGLLA